MLLLIMAVSTSVGAVTNIIPVEGKGALRQSYENPYPYQVHPLMDPLGEKAGQQRK